MITCIFRGRLGNHLDFIYTLFKYCKTYNIDFDKISFPRYEKYRIPGRENYFVKECFPLYSEFVQSKFDKDYIDTRKMKTLFRKDLKVNCKDNFYLYLFGAVIRDYSDLDLIEQLFYNKKNYDKVYEVRNYLGNNLGIHIRRGDFLNHKEYANLIVSKEKYKEMIKNNADKFDKIVIFSDSLKWCKENLENEYKDKVIFDESKLAYEGMIRMSSCKDIIMNNGSSYSKWSKILSPIVRRIYEVKE